MLASSQSRPSPMPSDVRQLALERCAREISEIQERRGVPAWLATLGVEDWEIEKRFIAHVTSAAASGSTAVSGEAKPSC